MTEDITLRDWLAGMALQPIYACSDNTPEGDARMAYQMADAMLAARGPAKPPAPQLGDLTERERHMIWRALIFEAADIERDPNQSTDGARLYRDLAAKFAEPEPEPAP